MPVDILNAMRALREDTRLLLLQSPEYRALVAIEAAIEEIAAIPQERRIPEAPAPELPVQTRPAASEIQMAPAPEAAQPRETPASPAATDAPPAARHSAIATAFAETLAAKLDPRNAGRQAPAYQPPRRVHFE